MNVFPIAVTETEDRSYSTAGYVGHRNEDSIESSSRSTGERCVGKVGIEVVAHEAQPRNVAGMDTNTSYSICKWTNTTEKNVSEKFGEGSRKQFVVKPKSTIDLLVAKLIEDDNDNQSNSKIAELIEEIEDSATLLSQPNNHKFTDISETGKLINTNSSYLEDITETIVVHDSDVLEDKMNNSPILKLQNQLVDPDKMKERTTSTSRPITPRARSVRLISLSNTSASSIRNSSETSNDTNEAVEEALESPLIVPSPRALGTRNSKEKTTEVNDKQPYLKKDHAKPSINLVDGKPNKVFYEIKPSLNTAMENDDDDMEQTSPPIITTTKRQFLSGFKLPSMPSSFGKFGPYFLDEMDRNVTERIGSTVLLDCKIGLLGDKKVYFSSCTLLPRVFFFFFCFFGLTFIFFTDLLATREWILLFY